WVIWWFLVVHSCPVRRLTQGGECGRELLAPVLRELPFQHQVEKARTDRLRHADRRSVREDGDAEALRRKQRHGRRRAEVKATGVSQTDSALVVITHIPTKPVVASLVRRRVLGSPTHDLRSVRLSQGLDGNDRLAVDLAVAELQPHPLSQVRS